MKDIEGTKDYYQHLLNSLGTIIKDWIRPNIERYDEDVDDLIDGEIDECLKDYGVDWRLDREEGKND